LRRLIAETFADNEQQQDQLCSYLQRFRRHWAFFYNRKWRHAHFTARWRQISNPTSYSESPL